VRSYKGRKECVLLFLVRACYHPRDKGTVYFSPGGEGKKKKKNTNKFYVLSEAGDLNSLTLLTVSDIFNSAFFFFFFLNCMDAKQENSGLPYHLPVSFSVHTGGYKESVLTIGIKIKNKTQLFLLCIPSA